MAVENKRLNTRILLKYDSYENWSTNNPNLLKGEMAIAVIDVADNTQTHSRQAVPQLLVKVGNGLEGEAGKYNSLPFVSGLAADVHSWAKAVNKPSYALHEISGAKEYRVVKEKKTVDGVEVENEFKYILQARKAGSSVEGDWAKVSTIDMAKIEARIAAIEGRMATAESDIDALEDTVGNSTKGLVKDVAELKAAVGEGGSVSSAIDKAIEGLASTISIVDTEDKNPLNITVKQENGLLSKVTASIDENTFDAYGSASTVEGKLTAYQTTNDAAVKAAKDAADAAQAGVDQEVKDRQAAISGLKMTAAVEGAQEGTVVKFIDKVNQENGIVSAELGELVFNSAYNASTNKAATMADVTSAVADLNGAMHFEGFTTTDPATGITIEGKPDYVAAAGDVVIYGIIEYVYDGSKWNKLGEEGALGTAIENLKGSSTSDASKTVTAHTQANGVVTLTYSDIAIAEGQVAGLTTKLATMQKEIDDEEVRAAAAEKVNADAIAVIEGEDKGSSMRQVAEDVATNGLNSLNSEKTLAADETVHVAKQENGAVSVTSQKIQLSNIDQVTGLPAALDLKATNADLDKAKERITANENAIAKLNGADTVVGSVANSIKTTIEGLDKADTAVAGQFVTSVSEENGVITVSRGAVNVKDLEQTDDTYVVFDCGSSSVNV